MFFLVFISSFYAFTFQYFELAAIHFLRVSRLTFSAHRLFIYFYFYLIFRFIFYVYFSFVNTRH